MNTLKQCDVNFGSLNFFGEPVFSLLQGCRHYFTSFNLPFETIEIGPYTNLKLLDENGKEFNFTNNKADTYRTGPFMNPGSNHIYDVIISPYSTSIEGFNNFNNIWIFILFLILIILLIYFLKGNNIWH